MPKIAKWTVTDYFEADGTIHMGTDCTITSGIMTLEWDLAITNDSEPSDISANWGTSGSGSYYWFRWNSTNGFNTWQYNPSVPEFNPAPDLYKEINKRYIISATYKQGYRDLIIDGNVYSTDTGDAVGSRPVWLFSNSPTEGRSKAFVKVYSLKVWDDTTLIGDFTPVMRKSDGLVGLWNAITNEVYYPGGHESFYEDIPWIQGEDLFPYNENFIPMPEKALSEPPDAIFRIDETDDLPHTNLAPVLNIPALTKPFPDAIFRIESDEMGGMPFNKLPPDCPALGAFANANNLSLVRIPNTVKSIGENSFTFTKLTSVQIANDCEYYDTSFPEGCIVKRTP